VDVSWKGATLFELHRTVDAGKLEELAAAIDTSTGAQTATLVPFFGPSLQGEKFVEERLEMDTSRVLLGEISYDWERPFRSGETVEVRLFVEDIYDKGNAQFAILTTEVCDASGNLIQRHRATFIERGA
jgi:hypothetical protein